MTPRRQHMIVRRSNAVAKVNGRRNPMYHEVRLLAQCYHKAPDRISAQERFASVTSCTGKMSMASPPRPCASVLVD